MDSKTILCIRDFKRDGKRLYKKGKKYQIMKVVGNTLLIRDEEGTERVFSADHGYYFEPKEVESWK